MTPSLSNDGPLLTTRAGAYAEQPFPPHLLVFDRHTDRAAGLVQELRAGGTNADVTIFDLQHEREVLPSDRVEVAAVNLDGAVPEGLVFAAALSAQVPSAQIVFWADGRNSSPGEEAARSLGVQRIVPRAQLVEWLGMALEPLARIARAKREQAEAEAALPVIPGSASERSAVPIPLPEAERCFREAYLRALLAQAANARSAAQQAGVPYTTLVSMLKKMGLDKALRSKGKHA